MLNHLSLLGQSSTAQHLCKVVNKHCNIQVNFGNWVPLNSQKFERCFESKKVKNHWSRGCLYICDTRDTRWKHLNCPGTATLRNRKYHFSFKMLPLNTGNQEVKNLGNWIYPHAMGPTSLSFHFNPEGSRTRAYKHKFIPTLRLTSLHLLAIFRHIVWSYWSKKFNVFITVVLGHFFSCSFMRSLVTKIIKMGFILINTRMLWQIPSLTNLFKSDTMCIVTDQPTAIISR